jgi:SAM-dependent methyltransferase
MHTFQSNTIPSPDDPQSSFAASYWNDRYKAGLVGWDLGMPSPPLVHFISTLPSKQIRILIPGAGNAYEADALLQLGFTDITILDYAPDLVEKLRDRYLDFPSVKVVEQNFFDHLGAYDLILEQTFFCALHPNQRPNYCLHMFSLLKEGGTLAGLLFNREFEVSPPFGGSENEYRSLFSTLFDTVRMEPCIHSVEPRLGSELFFELRKKPMR